MEQQMEYRDIRKPNRERATGRIDRDRFNSLKINLATETKILEWSRGEVTKPETLNYRTLKPEKDGLFCERIFGPVKDWECHCGKYKKSDQKKNITCDKCGVEVTRSRVRRERMGHIKLATPVTHIWFSKGAPSPLGLLLDIVQSDLDRIVYFGQYIVTKVDEQARENARQDLQAKEQAEHARLGAELKSITANAEKAEEAWARELASMKENDEPEPKHPPDWDAARKLADRYELHKKEASARYEAQAAELIALKFASLISEAEYRRLRNTYGADLIHAGMGAEAIEDVLKNLNLDELEEHLRREFTQTSGQRHTRVKKRMRLVKIFKRPGASLPESMIIKVLPVLPPDLRPMVQIGGMRFASSSLNDFYRRVVGRNNRLKYLIKMEAPDIMVRNEKRMLQEAVDALIDNSKRRMPTQNQASQNLRSLTDLMRGKQGRFRQNLLGKRVDYSGRAVIVSGPNLKFDQCGLPKKMALELFKPFVINILINQGHAQNIKSARRMIDERMPVAQDALEVAVKGHPVLLNRAPTLHRLGIQAFYPVLIEGEAIRLHPLVCTAFNADFDGDQMAVHVPLSYEAQMEARQLMVSSKNLLAMRSGTPIMLPTLDMVLGVYYMTSVDEKRYQAETPREFPNFTALRQAYELGVVSLRQTVKVRDGEGALVETTPGRVVFSQDVFGDANGVLADEYFQNVTCDRGKIEELVADYYDKHGSEPTAKVLDRIKEVGFKYATKSGTTISMHDITTPSEKARLLRAADKAVESLENMYSIGMMTDEELEQSTIDVWMDVSDKMTEAVKKNMANYGGIYTMSHSGAKGNLTQIKQMVGMRGLMSNPKGRIIKLPVKASLAEGLSVLEYFISTHGARKGLADTALRTADSGYLTRRLVDVAQEVIVLEEDCGNVTGIEVSNDTNYSDVMLQISERVRSRLAAEHVVHPETGEVLVEPDELITNEKARMIERAGVGKARVRSPLACVAKEGICGKCYGASLGNNQPSLIGEAVGVIAAQSIGEPGTQLTMRTFHTGGIVSSDITAGLPRVVEIFEARRPKGEAVLAEIGGKLTMIEREGAIFAKISKDVEYATEIAIPSTHKASVKSGQSILEGDQIMTPKARASKKLNLQPILSDIGGKVKRSGSMLTITSKEVETREYKIPVNAELLVKDGDDIETGQPLTAGPINPSDILRILGVHATQSYIVNEIQAVYRSQGVDIHDKHIEVIVRQMLRKVRITRAGDTDFLHDDIVERTQYESANMAAIQNGGEPAQATSILMGVTRASLLTRSFLSAASFQETSRVLTNAALRGASDGLHGLKENVIIGRLIPARLDISKAGREVLNWDEVERHNAEARRQARDRAIETAALKAAEDNLMGDAMDESRIDMTDQVEPDRYELEHGEIDLSIASEDYAKDEDVGVIESGDDDNDDESGDESLTPLPSLGEDDAEN